MFASADQDYMPTSDRDAKALGLSMYFTGKPCRKGHLTARYASSAECFFCRQQKNASIELKKKQQKWSEENKALKLQQSKDRYERNKNFERVRSRSKWLLNKEKVIESNKKWISKNPGIGNHYGAKRRAAVKNRTPSWANLEKIKEIYKNCPDGMVVDHIIPLQGKEVSGFHVETNLQYLTPEANQKKFNRLENQYVYA